MYHYACCCHPLSHPLSHSHFHFHWHSNCVLFGWRSNETELLNGIWVPNNARTIVDYCELPITRPYTIELRMIQITNFECFYRISFRWIFVREKNMRKTNVVRSPSKSFFIHALSYIFARAFDSELEWKLFFCLAASSFRCLYCCYFSFFFFFRKCFFILICQSLTNRFNSISFNSRAKRD